MDVKKTNGRAEKRFHVAPIPLERGSRKDIKKDDLIRFTLRSTPADEDSATFDLSVGMFEIGTPEEVLTFVGKIKQVILGQNATTGPAKFQIMRRMLRGDALAAFNAAAQNAGAETNANYQTAVNGLIEHVFPSRALAIQKQVMRRAMRKPKEMTFRVYMARLVEINNKLSLFPPFAGDAQKMDDSELLDIGEFAIPSSWQRQMILQDVDPLQGTIQNLVDFCERMERTELMDSESGKKN